MLLFLFWAMRDKGRREVGQTPVVVDVTLSSADGSENEMWPWNYVCPAYTQMEALESVDTKWVVTVMLPINSHKF